jgi:signal transduction histidine kinase
LQALLNLVQNAANVTEEGDVIELGSRFDGERLEYYVRDTGPGVPAADRRRIFERFERGLASRRSGTGLGLSITRSIAVAHGGTVRLETREGHGSTFFVSIPTEPVVDG